METDIKIAKQFLSKFHAERELYAPLFYERYRMLSEFCKENNISEAYLNSCIDEYIDNLITK